MMIAFAVQQEGGGRYKLFKTRPNTQHPLMQDRFSEGGLSLYIKIKPKLCCCAFWK